MSEQERLEISQYEYIVEYIIYWLKKGATIKATDPEGLVLVLDQGSGHLYGGLTISMPEPEPAWIPVSERLPTLEDAGDDGKVWATDGNEVLTLETHWFYSQADSGHFSEVSIRGRGTTLTHWMPKPKTTPPEPPR